MLHCGDLTVLFFLLLQLHGPTQVAIFAGLLRGQLVGAGQHEDGGASAGCAAGGQAARRVG